VVRQRDLGGSGSFSTRRARRKPGGPGWNPAPQGANGNVEFHLDTAAPAETSAGRDGTRPSKARMGMSSSISTQQRPLKPRWPGWNPALQRAEGSVQFHLDTAVPAETPLAETDTGTPRSGWGCRATSRNRSHHSYDMCP